MTFDTGTEVAREKFHIFPLPDVVKSHLNFLTAQDKKTLGNEPTFIYHSLLIQTLHLFLAPMIHMFFLYLPVHHRLQMTTLPIPLINTIL